MKKVILSLSVLIAASTSFADADVIRSEKTVYTSSGLSCNAFLFAKKNARPQTVLLRVYGTGIYSNGDLYDGVLNFGLTEQVDSGKLAILTYDKPGIRKYLDYDNDMEKKLENKEAFLKHTQADLIECSEKTLKWAVHRFYSKRILLHGHSEGAMLHLPLVTKLIRKKSALLPLIHTVYLTGLPMDTWAEGFEYQAAVPGTTLPELPKLYKAIEECDNDFLLSTIENGCIYLKDAMTLLANQDILRSLWVSPPNIAFVNYQGTKDPYENIQKHVAFDEENKRRQLRGFTHLNFTARYFDGGHNFKGFPEVRAEFAEKIAGEVLP